MYYINAPVLNSEAKRETDALAKVIGARQYVEWRELRFDPFTAPQVRRMLATMATQIVEALDRGQPTQTARHAAPVVGDPDRDTRQDASPGTSESVRGPAPKNEPPTLVVDALHRGDHATLGEALKAAKPGDRILVRPGLYREGVVIDRPVEIVGDGDMGDVVIEATGADAVLFRANMGRITNVTLRQAGGGQWYCVDIAQGRLDLEGCDISSQSLACVAIHGAADPRLRHNRIHDGKQTGIFVYNNGQGTLEDNDIFGNALAGVEIKEGGNPTLRRNQIHDGKTGGVYVHTAGQGTLEDNDIFRNRTGVSIKAGGNPTLRRNRIRDGKESGVFVYDNGRGTLEDNDIFGNTFAGVAIKQGGNPTLRHNRIHDGKASGVFVYENGQGALEDNDIFGNALAGVEIREGANPILRRNRIHDGKQSGVFVNSKGEGTLEGNDIFGNSRAGVTITEGGNPTLSRNRIADNRGVEIRVQTEGQGVIEDNDLRGNANGAWELSTQSADKIVRRRNQE